MVDVGDIFDIVGCKMSRKLFKLKRTQEYLPKAWE